MPVLNTFGGASAKRFGVMSAVDSGYAYYHINDTGGIYGSSPNVNSTAVAVNSYSTNAPRSPHFIFAKNKFIAGGAQASYNSGSTWSTVFPSYVYGDNPPVGGLNGVAAYRPTDDTVAVGYYNWYGDNQAGVGFSYARANGTSGSADTILSTGNTTGYYGMVYSPALDAFFWKASPSAGGSIRVYSGSSPSTLLSSGTLGNTSTYKLSISSDGYPIIPITPNGTIYYLYKITDTNLSYVNLGTISNNIRSNPSQFFYDTTTSLYYKSDIVSSTLYFGYSSDAVVWTNISAASGFYTPGSPLRSYVNRIDGSLYIHCTVYNGGDYPGYSSISYASSDGGTSWSLASLPAGSMASTKRITN